MNLCIIFSFFTCQTNPNKSIQNEKENRTDLKVVDDSSKRAAANITNKNDDNTESVSDDVLISLPKSNADIVVPSGSNETITQNSTVSKPKL